MLLDLPTQTEDANSTPGHAEQTQLLDWIRDGVYGPLGPVDHFDLLPRGGTLRSHCCKRKRSFSLRDDELCESDEAERIQSAIQNWIT